MQISYQTATMQRRRLWHIRQRHELDAARGLPVIDEGELAARATRYCLFRQVSPAAALAAHRAALAGQPHNATLDYIWTRGLILALTA